MTTHAAIEPSLIALVEDDALVAETVQSVLRSANFSTEWCRNGAALQRLLTHRRPALCIVDLGLPDANGLDLVRQLQSQQNCGILILTGRDFMIDRVLGLELGADDYMTKPFEPRELIARIRSILRRTGAEKHVEQPAPAALFSTWRYVAATLTLHHIDGQHEELSIGEARLLALFLKYPNQVMTRERLAGLGELAPLDRSIDVRVSRLRKRLREGAGEPTLIKTIYGAGYLFTGRVQWRADE